MYMDEDQPYYEGIELNVKKNTNTKQKRLTKNLNNQNNKQ